MQHQRMEKIIQGQNKEQSSIQENEKRNEKDIKKKSLQHKYQVKLKLHKHDWIDAELQLTSGSIRINTLNLLSHQLIAIKIYLEAKQQHQQFNIHLQYKHQQYKLQLQLGIPNSQMIGQIPLHYYIFTKIIHMKLKDMKLKDIKIKQNKQIPQKIKLPQKITFNSLISGKLFKKSQILSKWQQRTVVMNVQGLFSYPQINRKPTTIILWKDTKSILTQFQIYQQQNLVFKLISDKQTSFALPIMKFYRHQKQNNWLFTAYRLSIRFKQ